MSHLPCSVTSYGHSSLSSVPIPGSFLYFSTISLIKSNNVISQKSPKIMSSRDMMLMSLKAYILNNTMVKSTHNSHFLRYGVIQFNERYIRIGLMHASYTLPLYSRGMWLLFNKLDISLHFDHAAEILILIARPACSPVCLKHFPKRTPAPLQQYPHQEY